MGTNCPRGPIVWGLFVKGDQLSWGPFVHGDQMFGDQLSRGTNCLGDQMSRDCLFLGTNWGGPNVRGLNVFGTKCSGPNVCKMLNDDTRLMWLDNLEITSFLYRSVLSYASLLDSQRDKISEFLLIFQSIRIQQCC